VEAEVVAEEATVVAEEVAEVEEVEEVVDMGVEDMVTEDGEVVEEEVGDIMAVVVQQVVVLKALMEITHLLLV
jgi:hypothetical protein